MVNLCKNNNYLQTLSDSQRRTLLLSLPDLVQVQYCLIRKQHIASECIIAIGENPNHTHFRLHAPTPINEEQDQNVSCDSSEKNVNFEHTTENQHTVAS